MPVIKALVEGLTALEIAFALLLGELDRLRPELTLAFASAVDAILATEDITPGIRRNLEMLRELLAHSAPPGDVRH